MKRDKTIKDVPDGYDEEKPGRPAIKLSRYDTDQANMGRDPLGKAGLTADDQGRSILLIVRCVQPLPIIVRLMTGYVWL